MIELPAKRASRFHTIRQPRGAEPHGLGLASVIEHLTRHGNYLY